MENPVTLQVGVKALLRNKRGEYLLLRRSLEKYPEIKGRWDIVGGRIDPGTPLIDNLRREIKEETGLELRGEPKLLIAQDILRNPQKHVVRLTYLGEADGEIALDTGENDQYKWYSWDELLHLDDVDMYFKQVLDDPVMRAALRPAIVPLELFAIYFSPYTAHAIVVNGVQYPTVEHAYQCSRYDDPKIIDEIRAAASPVKAWKISSKYKPGQRPDFRDRKFEVMKQLMRAKADQHEEVRKALLDSGDLAIVKHITTYPPGDGVWDDGPDGAGENRMGKMWMEIRAELRGSARKTAVDI